MANYTAGSVSAEIKLDTTKFKEAIKQLKTEVKELSETFNSVKGGKGVTEEIEQLKKQMESLQKTNEDYREQLQKLREESKKRKNSIKEETDELNKYNEALVKVDRTQQSSNNVPKTFEKTAEEIAKAKKELEEWKASWKNADKAPVDSSKKASVVLGEVRKETEKLGDGATKAAEALNKLKMPSAIGHNIWGQWGKELEEEIGYHLRVVDTQFKGVFAGIKEEQWTFFEAATKGWNDYQARLSRIADSLKAKWHSMSVELAKANAAQYKYWTQIRGSANVEGYNQLKPLYGGYGTYLAEIGKIQEAVSKINFDNIRTAEFKEQLIQLAEALKTTSAEMNQFSAASDKIITSMDRMARVNEVSAELKRLGQSISNFSSLSNTNSKALSKFNEQAEILKDRLRVLETEFMEGRMAEEVYASETEKVAAQMQKLKAEVTTLIRELNLENIAIGKNGEVLNKNSAEYKKIETNARQAGRGITSFNNGVVQTAHSGRILSNTLYQIRGALLSLKMILTAMGGMALWGFAMEIAEGVKTTFTAKNEMEEQLKQNSKVGANGLRDFNKALDETISKFQKVNKYQLGETVSSLGVEFDLTMKQMKKAMPIVAMVQSEYIRAGRTSEEAALAVKDILQGEFQRLSRETGVGKEELTQYGWSGDKTDLDSLLDAVKKAGEARHWNVFAEKATSLNDVLEITKNRFEEFGADFLQSISPMVVSAFNTIIGAIDKLQNAFNGMGSFSRNALIGGGFIGGITAIGTLLPMITKGMGLAEIATLGWGKSLGTAVLNLNKAEVAQYGFKKALAAVISGTKAAELSETRWTKAIAGRLLGVNQSILAQRGYKSAIFNTSMAMREGIDLSKASVNLGRASVINLETMTTKEMGRAQKLAYLTNNIKLNEAAEMSRGKAILRTATSVKVLSVAFKGLLAIGVVAWFASVATWADAVKKRFDLFNDFIDNGKDKIKSAQKTVDNYNKKLNEMSADDPNRKLTESNAKVAQHNLDSVTQAYKLAKQIKKTSEETAEANDLMIKGGLNEAYAANGLKNAEEWGLEYQEMKKYAYDAALAEKERYKFEYQSLQHINEHTAQMKAAGIEEEKRIQYITEYAAKAQEAAENLKKFNQGDLTAGVYYLLNRIQLLWIDLWNDKDFLVFWDTVKRTFNDLKPTLNWLKDTLIELGRNLMKYFSTEQGRWVGTIIGAGAAFAIIGYKLKGLLSPLKTVWGGLKKVGGKLKDVKDGWKSAGEEAEKASEKMGGKTSDETPDKSTGGIAGDTGKESWRSQTWGKIKEDATSYARAAVGIAAAMLLVSEAIIMLQAPMGALAATGWVFKQLEPNIKQGIEGLKLIAPVMAAFLPPVVALMFIMKYYSASLGDGAIGKAALASAKVIAAGMLLISEAIVMMVAPMVAIAAVGYVKELLGDSVEKGKAAIEATTDALSALVPVIPLFVIAIAAGVIALTGVGGLVSAAIIASGMLLVSGAIVSLAMPMAAIAALGALYPDTSGIEAGSKTIKATAEALNYLTIALGDMVLVDWALITHYIDQLILNAIGVDLSSLTEDGGFFTQLETFIKDFNEKVTLDPIDQTKVENLKAAADSIGAVGDALQAAKTAMDNLPDEFKNGGNPANSDALNGTAYQAMNGTEETTTGFFDQFKAPLKELKTFIHDFNTSDDFAFEEVNMDRVAAIESAASAIEQINNAVTNVKNVLGNIGWANINANVASATGSAGGGFSSLFGGIGAMFNLATGVGANGASSGSYQSSIGSSLNEMELVIKDLITFNGNVNSILGSDTGTDNSGSVTTLTQMVTDVSNAIQQVIGVLDTAVPTARTSSTNIGSAISGGIKAGMGDLTNLIVPPFITAMNSLKANAGTYGKGAGWKLTHGFDSELKLKEATESEVKYTMDYLDTQKPVFYDKGAELGQSLSDGYKSKGLQQQSPGLMARTTLQEMYYIQDSLEQGMSMLPNYAVDLGNSLTSNFNPSFDVGGISVDELGAFQSGLSEVTSMATTTDTQTSMAFSDMNTNVATNMQGMTTSVNGAFNNINTNATTSYAKITNTTRTSLKNMQDQTTKNISNIKNSWHEMQRALIASAENIRSETSSKIKTLESNMASFWNKVQNPALLLSGPSNMPQHTINRNRGRSLGGRLMAGNSPKTGISNTIKPRGNTTLNLQMREKLAEYLQCLLSDGFCAAGWRFNWTPKILDSFRKWRTNFGEIYDPYLNVGKFENDNFPVRGIAEIAKKYIEDAIGRTSYEHYYNYKYGSPLAAWNAGHFNCVEGAEVAIAFANAFGFPGGSLRYTTWDGEGHAYAYIPGLGNIDATAIQGGYGLTASKVRYSGSKSVNTAPPKSEKGTTVTIGDIHVHINGEVENAKEKGKEIADEINKRIFNVLKRSDATGL